MPFINKRRLPVEAYEVEALAMESRALGWRSLPASVGDSLEFVFCFESGCRLVSGA